MKQPRILFFDVEATNLDLDAGYLLVIGYKWLGDKKATLLRAARTGQGHNRDRALLQRFYRIMEQADMVVSFFGKEFDWKAVQTRGYLATEGPLPPTPHVDLYFTAKRNFKLHSGRLNSLAQFLKCPLEKTPLDLPVWVDAMCGDKKAFEYVVEHCRLDVDILEWCYGKMRGYVRQHPAMFARIACRSCGSMRLQSRGYAIRLLVNGSKPKRGPSLVRRIQCQNCGRWDLVL